MGKYMRKAKITGDVAVMEVLQSSLGVRTRAKTLALLRLQATAATKTPPPPEDGELCYLKLRSRRLDKSQFLSETGKQTHNRQPQRSSPVDCCRRNPEQSDDSKPRAGSRLSMTSSSVGSVSVSSNQKEEKEVTKTIDGGANEENGAEEKCDLGFEASFGDNNVEFETRERSTRESTPCSLIGRELEDTIGRTGNQNRRTGNEILRNVPTALEIDEFFAFAERQQQQHFMEKYNYDFVKDSPLPGPYEWVKVNP